MSKLQLDKINFNNDDFVVQFEDETSNAFEEIEKEEKPQKIEESVEFAIISQAKEKAQKIIADAEIEAQNKIEEIVSKAKKEAEIILAEAKNTSEMIIQEATSIKETSLKETNEFEEKSKLEIEQLRIQSAKEGYEEGHKDGLEKIQEELEEKINSFDNFCKNQLEIKDKILKSASRDILDLIIHISKQILLKEVTAETIKKIIEKTINLLEKKEDINIILSEKYAKLLFELQEKSLDSEPEFDFKNFKQFEGFSVIYNPKFDDDTIIVENLKERFDASITSQMNIIIRNIYENSNLELDLEKYTEEKIDEN